MASSWRDFEIAEPAMAAFGRDRLDGKVAYLATVRRDGTPRVHPVTVILGSNACYLFIDPASRKLRDLSQDARYSLHCAMSDSSGSSGEFQMCGRVMPIEEEARRADAQSASTFKPPDRFLLFELLLEEVVSTVYRGGRPDRRIWNTPSA